MTKTKIYAIYFPQKNILNNLAVPDKISIWKGATPDKALFNILKHYHKGTTFHSARSKDARIAKEELMKQAPIENMVTNVDNLVKEIVKHNNETNGNTKYAPSEIGSALYDMDIARSKAEALRLGREALKFYYVTRN